LFEAKSNTEKSILIPEDQAQILDWVRKNYTRNPELAEKYLEEIERNGLSLGIRNMCDYFNLKALVKRFLGDTYNSIALFRQGIAFAMSHNLNDQVAKLNINLSTGYGQIYNYKKAEECIKNALAFNIPEYNTKAQFNLIRIYDGLSDDELTLQSIEKSKELALKYGDRLCHIQASFALIEYYYKRNHFDKLEMHCGSYEKLCQTESSNYERAHNLRIYAHTLRQNEKVEESLELIDEAIKLANIDHQTLELYRLYLEGMISAEQTGNIELAENYYKLLYGSEKIENMEDVYYGALRMNIKLKKAKGSKKELQKAYASFKTFSASHLTLKSNTMDSAQIEFIEREIEEVGKINEKIVQQHQELETVSYMLSNELNLPVNNIIEYVTLLSKQQKENENDIVQEYLDYLIEGAQSAQSTLQMADSFLNYEVGQETITIDIKRTIQRVIDNFDINSYEFTQIGESFKVQTSHNIIYDLFYNVFHFVSSLNNRDQKHIKVTIEEDKSISISDAGNGVYNALDLYRLSKEKVEKYRSLNYQIAFMMKIAKMINAKYNFSGYDIRSAKLVFKIPSINSVEIL